MHNARVRAAMRAHGQPTALSLAGSRGLRAKVEASMRDSGAGSSDSLSRRLSGSMRSASSRAVTVHSKLRPKGEHQGQVTSARRAR